MFVVVVVTRGQGDLDGGILSVLSLLLSLCDSDIADVAHRIFNTLVVSFCSTYLDLHCLGSAVRVCKAAFIE